MDEMGFLDLIVTERMRMHYEEFKKEYPPTEEQEAEKEKAWQIHELLLRKLDKELGEQLELWEGLENSRIVRENEYYYRAGFRDGVNLDRLIQKIKEEKI